MNREEHKIRIKYGRIATITGIIVNFILFLLKLIIGILSSSIAITADAINNFSDTVSSIVALIGFNLSEKPADEDHPFGHGRMEYISALILSVVIIALGLDFIKESINRIINPTIVSVDTIGVILIIIAILTKVGMFFFYNFIGKKINSLTLKAVAFDSLSDIVSTSVVLASILFAKFSGIIIDGYVGIIVSGLIIFAGIMLVKEAMNPLLGELPDKKIVKELENTLLENPNIHGVHDIIIHSYGPNSFFATAHAEVSQNLNSLEVHNILEHAEVELAKKMPITLVLHADPFDKGNPELLKLSAIVENSLLELDARYKIYDFRISHDDYGKLALHFHLLSPNSEEVDRVSIHEKISSEIGKISKNFELNIEYIKSFV